jgi:FkbM family methyltransferase
LIRKWIAKLPQVRGQHRLQIILDSILGPAKLQARKGIQLEGYYSSVQDMAFLRPVSENPLLEELICGLHPAAAFVDCGANCGFYSALASSVLGDTGVIVSIEPSPREYTRLLYARQRNLSPCQWITVNCALGMSEGVAAIDSSVGHTGMNQIAREGSSGNSTGISRNSIPVLIERLDRVLNATMKDRPSIDLIKIDVEGYELQVLRGVAEHLQAKRIQKLVIEITDSYLQVNGDSKNALFEFMQYKGYYPTVQSDDWQYDEVFTTKP